MASAAGRAALAAEDGVVLAAAAVPVLAGDVVVVERAAEGETGELGVVERGLVRALMLVVGVGGDT